VRRRDPLVEIDQNLLRVSGIDLYGDSRSGLDPGQVDNMNILPNRHAVWFAARDFHPEPDLANVRRVTAPARRFQR
jgi:hypothetical protein